MEAGEQLAAGQCWTFDTSHGFDDARIIIGALVSPASGERIICFSVTRAPTVVDGGVQTDAMISFIPITESAFRHSVRACTGTAEPPREFADELYAWQADPRGLTIFTVPFDGCLDRLLARQAASLITSPAA